jgi:hypothetical protein
MPAEFPRLAEPDMDVQRPEWSSDARGVSLLGLLMVVLALGALTATAMVGVSSLTGNGDGTGIGRVRGVTAGAAAAAAAAQAAAAAGVARAAPGAGSGNSALISCRVSAAAARAASTLYFANSGGRSYPVKWSDMTTSNSALYELTPDVVINRVNATELDGRGWRLTMSGGGATPPTFTCS